MLAFFLAATASLGAPTPASRAAPKLPPPAALEQARHAQYGGPQSATLFLNFDGAQLRDDTEDSRTNSTLIGYAGPFERYGTGTKRAAVLQAVWQDWKPFAADITDTRPESGDYTMVMVGPTNFTEGSLGIALLDCGNKWTPNNIVYAFHSADDGFTAAATATTISQEIAHSFGLEHVDDDADVMYPYNTGGDPSFTHACHPVREAAGIGILCTEQHEASCGRPDRQNGYTELMRFMGPRPADLSPPSVWFTTPESGTRFDDGETFVLAADAQDNEGVVAVELLAGGELVATDDASPFSWEVRGAPPGTYHFEARAYDAAGNSTITEVLVLEVTGEPGDTDGETDGWDTDGDPLSFGSTGDAPEEEEDAPPDAAVGSQTIPPGEDPFDPFAGQCDCRSGAPAPSALWMMLLLAVARRRNAG